MKESKGWEFLTAFEEIDEKYIYQAAKPWKENKIVIVQHYIRGDCPKTRMSFHQN